MHLPGHSVTHDRFGPIHSTTHPHPETQGQIRIWQAWQNLKGAITTLDDLTEALRLRGIHSDEAIKFFTDLYKNPRIAESVINAQKDIEDAVDELCRAMMDVGRDRMLILPGDIPARLRR